MDQVQYSFVRTSQAVLTPIQRTALNGSGAEEHWHAVYTVPRHEKSLSRQLALRSVDHFLPLYCSRRKWNDGSKVTLELPLFPGYVFVRISRAARIRVLESPGALYMVGGMGNEPAQIPSAQIDILRNGLIRDHSQPHPLLTIGQRVRIIRGALTGAEGILQRLKNGCRVVITIDILMQSVAVEVDTTDLELLD